jgi:hypothetical protein
LVQCNLSKPNTFQTQTFVQNGQVFGLDRLNSLKCTILGLNQNYINIINMSVRTQEIDTINITNMSVRTQELDTISILQICQLGHRN